MRCSIKLARSVFNDRFISFIVRDFSTEGPPVPIPNTEVKLCSGNNTRRVTAREDSSSPTSFDIFRRLTDGCLYSYNLIFSSLAQLAERVTVNHDVVGSSPTGGAIPIPIFFRNGFLFSPHLWRIICSNLYFLRIFQKKYFFEKNPLDKIAYYLLKYTPGDKKGSFSQLPFSFPKISHPPLLYTFSYSDFAKIDS